MIVKHGISVKDEFGGLHSLQVSLDWNDLLRLVEEGKVPGWKLDTRKSMGVDDVAPELRPPERIVIVNDEGAEISVTTAWDWLRRWVNRLLIVHMHADGLITAEEAARQIKELFARVPS